MKYNSKVEKTLSEFKNSDFCRKDSFDKNQKIYDNQINAAKEMVLKMTSFDPPNNEHDSRNRHIILGAQMQSGKTGALMGLINVLDVTGLSKSYFNIDTYFILSGMNDNGWQEQTKKRAELQLIGVNENNLDCGEEEIEKEYTKPTYVILKNYEIKVSKHKLKNCLIIIDESHFGSSANSVLTKFLNKNGIDWKNDLDSLKRNNIYIVSVSATPFDELHSDLADCKEIVLLENDQNYVGLVDFYDNDQIKEATNKDFKLPKKSLTGGVAEQPIITYIKDSLNRMVDDSDDGEPKGVVIVRANKNKESVIVKNEFIKNNFRILLMNAKDMGGIKYGEVKKEFKLMMGYSIKEDSEFGKPLLILVKGGYRAAITIDEEIKDYIYMIYDYSLQIYATPQGLAGRMCGYRKNLDLLKRTLFYVNNEHIIQYVDWIINNLGKTFTPSPKHWIEEGEMTQQDLTEFTLQTKLGVLDVEKYTRARCKLFEFPDGSNGILEKEIGDDDLKRISEIYEIEDTDTKREKIEPIIKYHFPEISPTYIGELFIKPQTEEQKLKGEDSYKQSIMDKWFVESGSSLRVDARGHSDYLKKKGKSERMIKNLKLQLEDIGATYVHVLVNYRTKILRLIYGSVVKYYRKDNSNKMIKQHKRTDLENQ